MSHEHHQPDNLLTDEAVHLSRLLALREDYLVDLDEFEILQKARSIARLAINQAKAAKLKVDILELQLDEPSLGETDDTTSIVLKKKTKRISGKTWLVPTVRFEYSEVAKDRTVLPRQSHEVELGRLLGDRTALFHNFSVTDVMLAGEILLELDEKRATGEVRLTEDLTDIAPLPGTDVAIYSD